LLRNENGTRNNWLGLQLIAAKSNPGAVGAIISWQAGGIKRTRLKTSGGSYLASHDPRELLGIGSASKVDILEIRWPSGTVQRITDLPVNKYVKIVEREGLSKTATAKSG
jgi:enediyne biosynthesis protein E4